MHFSENHRRSKYSIDDIAQQAVDDGTHTVYVGDEWSRMAEEDVAVEKRIRAEDLFLKQTAEEKPGNMSAYNMSAKREDIPEVGGFWSHLEHQDNDIQQALTGEQDPTRYHELKQIQDEEFTNAVTQMERPLPAPTYVIHNHTYDFESKIREPWPDMEAKDRERERKIHADPNLKMIQKSDVLRRKKWHQAFS